MRKFGTDAPDYFAFQLGDGEKVYKIPLAASMPVKVLYEMQEAQQNGELFKYQLGLLKKYIGEEADELSAGTVREILKAWLEESNGQGATVGESSASSES